MNRIVIITGSTRCIGLAIAQGFLKRKDKVIVFCRHKNHLEEATEVLSKIASPEDIFGTVCDVRISADVKRVVAETINKFGRIDILINNAGTALWKLTEEISELEWDDVLDTNLKGPFLFTREVLPVMKRQKAGIIINISSGLGEHGGAKYSAYSASKFGVIGLTQCVAAETSQTGDIKVYAVLPGAVATKLHLDIHPSEDPSSMMTPEYVAEKILELAEGYKITGSSVEIYS